MGVVIPFPHHPLTEQGFEPGDCVCPTRGYFDNGCTFGTIQRIEDADAYVEAASDLYRLPTNQLVMAL